MPDWSETDYIDSMTIQLNDKELVPTEYYKALLSVRVEIDYTHPDWNLAKEWIRNLIHIYIHSKQIPKVSCPYPHAHNPKYSVYTNTKIH